MAWQRSSTVALRERRFTDAALNCEAILKLADSPRWDAERRKRFRKEHDALESDPMAPEPLRAKFRSDEAF